MLRKKALRKMFITTLSMLIILTVYTIPTTSKPNVLRTNLEIEDITNLKTDKIYLLNKENYLVKTDVFIDSKKIEKRIEKIIDYLIINNNKIPSNLNGYIPKNTKLLDINIESNSVLLNFSKEFKKSSDEEIMITGIVYSLLEIEDIKEVSFQVENKFYKDYNNLNKDIGINKNILYTNRNNISKVVTYYLDESDNYYVPVTNYINDKREKIEIIVEDLTSNYIYEGNLKSFLNSKVKLMNYEIKDSIIELAFNKVFMEDINNKNITEEVVYTLCYSIFDNYDVDEIIFKVDNKEILKKSRKDIE